MIVAYISGDAIMRNGMVELLIPAHMPVYPIERVLRQIYSHSCYLAWGILDCDRHKTITDVTLDVGEDQFWDKDNFQVGEQGKGQAILTFAARAGSPRPQLHSSFPDLLAMNLAKSLRSGDGQFELKTSLYRIPHQIATTEIIYAPQPVTIVGYRPR